ncbi:MAG: hypothetical protein ACOC1Q_01750 [Desulfosalsimonas sp.]
MKRILYIYQSGHYLNQENISRELYPDIFEVHFIELDSFDRRKTVLSDYDLAIIHLHPDMRTSWELYLDLKYCLPEFSVLALM